MKLNSIHKDWLINQKITEGVLKTFNIHTSSSGHITFPVHNKDGEFIFNKYRRSPELTEGTKYTYDRGGVISLYGLHLAKDEHTILITEGEKDCLVAWSHNIPAITSTGGALSFQNEWIELFKDKEIIVCFDNDKAGGEGMAKLAKLFGLENLKYLFIPERGGVKDISDYVTSGGDFHKLIRTAKSFPTLEDLEEDKGECESLWKSTYFHEAFTKEEKHINRRQVKVNRKFDGSDIENAKTYPLHQIYKFGNDDKAVCLFHNEKTGSLHYYPKTNSAYCFGGCGKSYDVIDIYQQIHNVSLKEAIKELNNFNK